MRQHVYLVPGFFGFANLGELKYFGHVRRFLIERAAARRLDIAVHIVKSPPTSSLPVRTACLAQTISRTHAGRDPLHLIGHSSGGLDCRLLVAPRVALPTRVDVEHLAARVRTLVTVATPHYGTPLASSLGSLLGQQLLASLSLSTIYVLRFGEVPITALMQLGGIFACLDNLAVNSALLDELFGRLLANFSVGRRRSVRRLLEEVVADQALVLQLTPEAMDVFNAATPMRSGIRYGSVVTRARRPGMRAAWAAGVDPSAHATRAIYNTLYRLAARMPRARARRITGAQARSLQRAYGRLPKPEANDGVVPTQSQVWGKVIHAAYCDHLDVIGHFGDLDHVPPHYDWLTTGSEFTRKRFEAAWNDVAEFLWPRTR